MNFPSLPRLPLEGGIDLTYRCNLDCRHCWIRLNKEDRRKKQELSFEEIRNFAQQARALGTQRWALSGGEPMLREDFAQIFDFLTRRAVTYTLNTNGTLITPAIARLLRRKGTKLLALYGATAAVHDRVTRFPGSYEALMRGIAYLREAGAGFILQIVPMRSNWHQYRQMGQLAEAMAVPWRVGSAWLYASASGSAARNRMILGERLHPAQVVVVDPPSPGYDSRLESMNPKEPDSHPGGGDRIFAACIRQRQNFHIDPYGGMSFCSYIQDPALRYNLKKGTVGEAWEEFIPSLAKQVRGGKEFRENCGSCQLRLHCRWCGVYARLERGRYCAPVPYLCELAREAEGYRNRWIKTHRRFYRIGGITIQLDSDLPFAPDTFASKFRIFETREPGEDTVYLRLHFQIPDLKGKDLGRPLYRKPPHAIYRRKNAWIYLGIPPEGDRSPIHRLAVFSSDHGRGNIHIDRPDRFTRGGLEALSLFSSDQILLARMLASRGGFSLHAAGVVMEGAGLLFIGPSESGKSTTARLLEKDARILCDEYMIVREWPEGFKIHGTWSHGDFPRVSAGEAPLKGIFFLEKSGENRLDPILGGREVVRRLLPRLLKPLITADWWEDVLGTVERLVRMVPACRMRFDRSGQIAKVLGNWLARNEPGRGSCRM